MDALHASGLRALPRDEGGTVAVVAALRIDGAAVDAWPVFAATDDEAGRAARGRALALAEAVASFLSYGGTAAELAIVASAFGAIPPLAPAGMAHVTTRVDATRRHVFRRDDGLYALVTEDQETEVMAADEVQARLMQAEAEAADPWGFLDAYGDPELEGPGDGA